MGRRKRISDQWRTRAVLACAVTAASFFLAHIINGIVAYSIGNATEYLSPQRSLEADARVASSQEYRQEIVRSILASGIFLVPPPPKESLSSSKAAVAVQKPLNLAAKVNVLGIVSGGQLSVRAIIEEIPSKRQGLYRLSERIPDVGELAAIEKDRVLLREGGQEEWVELAIAKEDVALAWPDFPVAPLKNSRPLHRMIDRAQLVHLVSTPEAYVHEARFQPHFNASGKADGIHIDGLRQAGVLEKAGFENSDVLVGINGVEIREPNSVWDLFQRVQQERTMRFNIVRQNQPRTWVIEVRE